MYRYLHRSKYPQSQSTASNMLAAISTVKIKPDETLEAFSKRLRDMYKVVTSNGMAHQEHFLVRSYIDGLDKNYDETRTLLLNNALTWYEDDLATVVAKANQVKLNKIEKSFIKYHVQATVS